MKNHKMPGWKGYAPIALLALRPDELKARARLEFREAHDDLDVLQESAFSGARGTVFGLVSYPHSGVPGTELLAHEQDLHRGIEDLLDEALDSLRVSRDAVRWVRPAFKLS